MSNKFRFDPFGKKRIAELEKELETVRRNYEWVGKQSSENRGCVEVRIGDGEFIGLVADRFDLPVAYVKKVLDFIEAEIPKRLVDGKTSVVWQGLGTFFTVKKLGKLHPRIRFHKAFYDLLRGAQLNDE